MALRRFPPNKGFQKRLRWLRLKFNMTQTELAEKAGTSYSRISDFETGKGFPSVQNLERLADAFGVSMDALWRGKRKKGSE